MPVKMLSPLYLGECVQRLSENVDLNAFSPASHRRPRGQRAFFGRVDEKGVHLYIRRPLYGPHFYNPLFFDASKPLFTGLFLPVDSGTLIEGNFSKASPFDGMKKLVAMCALFVGIVIALIIADSSDLRFGQISPWLLGLMTLVGLTLFFKWVDDQELATTLQFFEETVGAKLTEPEERKQIKRVDAYSI